MKTTKIRNVATNGNLIEDDETIIFNAPEAITFSVPLAIEAGRKITLQNDGVHPITVNVKRLQDPHTLKFLDPLTLSPNQKIQLYAFASDIWVLLSE